MTILDQSSLWKTVDNANQAWFDGLKISPAEGAAIAGWITSRQGKSGGYRGMYAPTSLDLERGIILFSGEKVDYAAARHILGQEAAHAIARLGIKDSLVERAYQQATGWIWEQQDIHQQGTFCCGRCTLAVWRHLSIVDFDSREALLVNGLKNLKSTRDGEGQWGRYPFYYTLYTLLDLDLEPAVAELRYALPRLERLQRTIRSGDYSDRRKVMVERALQKATRY